MYSYTTKGVCSRKIDFDVVDNKVCNVSFLGGCNGNLKAIAKLVEGMEVEKVIKILETKKTLHMKRTYLSISSHLVE